MKREDIEKILSNDDELSNQISRLLDMVHEEINSVKDDLTTLTQERDDALKELDIAKDTIKKLGKSAESQEAVQAQLDEYKRQNEELIKERDAQKVANAIELAIIKANGKNPKTIHALLDSEKIRLEKDGTVSGIDEQIKDIMKTDSYLFDDKKSVEKEVKPPSGYQGPRKDNPDSKAGNEMAKYAQKIMSQQNPKFNIKKD